MSAIHRLRQKNTILLLLLLVIAFILRFYRLGLEGFWLDELYVANEADPHQSLKTLFDSLKCCDQHPPLFYLLERGVFYFFGCTETTARLVPAAAGVASVYAVYLLGKELAGSRLGLIAAALTCVNHFNIYYSREARDYILAFLFATLSLVYLLRLLKYLRTSDMWRYALFALLTLYSHYFGLFLVFSEYCAAALFFFFDKDKKLFAKRFIGSGLIILVGFSVWLPVLLSFTKVTSFWITALPGDWLFTFFGNYFGDTPDLIHIMAALAGLYVLGVLAVLLFARRGWKWPGADRPALVLGFVVLGITTVISLGIPDVRSRLVTPMLLDRYTIIVLPAILMAIAYGIDLIPWSWVRMAGLAFLLFFSLQREAGFLKTWSKHYKTQFRELTEYMAADKNATAGRYPIVNDRVGWFESYYVRKFDYPGELLVLPKAAVIDSLVAKSSPRYDVDGFWLMDAHGAGQPAAFLDGASQKKLDSFFVKVKECSFIDGWAQLYRRKTGNIAINETNHIP